ncbi:Hypothetical predicted protein [Octopus vulgaris]|uniref:Uncharacterized protein n=1 Tax=Octopus vulgaris TaxID=6645 RepID=A0AA36AV73_OCTVU|nr:Hypothetical predicted protein [Octopus vulgaris]
MNRENELGFWPNDVIINYVFGKLGEYGWQCRCFCWYWVVVFLGFVDGRGDGVAGSSSFGDDGGSDGRV